LKLKVVFLGLFLSFAQSVLSQTHIVNYYAFRSDYTCLLVEDSTIWAGSVDGLVCLDRASDRYRRYTPADGLPSLRVYCITRDRTGKLWVGTWNGLAWFDGSRWEPVPEVSYCVRSLAVNKDRLWVGAAGYVYEFDVVEWRSHNYLNLKASIFCLYVDDENILWVGTAKGLWRFDGRDWDILDGLPDGVMAVIKDSKGNYWFGTSAGVVRWDGKDWEVFDTTDGLSSNYVTDVEEDHKGHIWVVAGKNRLCEYDGERWIRHDLPGSPSVRKIAFGRSGDLWLATDKGIYHRDGRRWGRLLTHDSLNAFACPIINDIFIDAQGNVWLATGRGSLITCGEYPWGGLVKYDGKHFTVWDTSDGLPSINITGVVGDNLGNIWIGTYKGISRFDGKEFVNFTTVE